MNARHHEEWTLQLSAYMDGDLEPHETEALEAHLGECATCRGVLADLEEIVARAHALGGSQPSRDLWPGIAQAIRAEATRARAGAEGPARVIRFPGSPEPRRRDGLFLTMPQLAAASVVLAVVSAAATWWAGVGLAGSGASMASAVADTPATLVSQVAAPSPEMAEELATLESVLGEARDRLDPNTVRILEKNLGVIQRAIDESVRALTVDPNNPFLRDHLDRAYREKADFLREVNAIVGWEG